MKKLPLYIAITIISLITSGLVSLGLIGLYYVVRFLYSLAVALA